MKRMISIALSLFLLLGAAACPVVAEETDRTVEYLEDGSYIVTTIEKTDTHGTRMNTTVGSAVKRYYSSDDVLQWKMTVTGEFLYDGTTVSCTYATGVTTVIETDYWFVTNESATAGSNTAFYTVTFARKELGVIVARPSYSVSITCDANGNLS